MAILTQQEISISGRANSVAQGAQSALQQQVKAALDAGGGQKPASTPTQPASGAAAKIVRTVNAELRSALITSALAQIKLRPAGWIEAADVAEIRADAVTGQFVLDFRSLRTINGIAYNAPAGSSGFNVAKLRVWTGTKFGDEFTGTAAGTSVVFSEQLTERVLVNFSNPTGLTVELLRKHLALSLPGAPGDLRLTIGPKVVWADPGPIRLDGNGLFVQSVDITKDLTAALAATEAPLEIMLSAAYPALLELDVAAVFQRRHDVDLGGSLSVLFSEPGTSTTLLALPAPSATWQIQALELTVEAELPEQRTLPASTPAAATDVRLSVGSDHALAIGLGVELDRSFSKLTSVWIVAEVPPAGAEVAGALYTSAASGPDTSAPLMLIPPFALAATTTATWFELPLASELELATSQMLWLELQATRGTPAIVPAALAAPAVDSAAPPAPAADAPAPILRGAPGGPFGAFKIKLNGAPLVLRGLTRLSGTPRNANATPALLPSIGVAVAAATEDPGFTPERSGTTRRIDLQAPLTGAGLKGVLPLALESRVAGSYRFTSIRVFYTLSGDAAALLLPSGGNA